jgi:hypothetical protein
MLVPTSSRVRGVFRWFLFSSVPVYRGYCWDESYAPDIIGHICLRHQLWRDTRQLCIILTVILAEKSIVMDNRWPAPTKARGSSHHYRVQALLSLVSVHLRYIHRSR